VYDRVLHVGIDARTAPELVDRVLFSNFVFLVGTLLNATIALLNLHSGYFLLAALNGLYQVAIVLGLALNRRHLYVAARCVFLSLFYAGLGTACALQGPVVQMEHFFLMFCVLAFSMFHPSERRYGVAFALVAAGLYLFFASQTGPLLDLLPEHHYRPTDLLANKLAHTLLLIVCVLGMSNAYRRAIRIVDAQRAKLFDAGRLAALGSMACSIAHEINTPLMAIDIELDALEAGDMRAIEKIGQASSRIATIVRGFKLLSHSESDDPMIDLELGDLVDNVRNVLAGRMKPLGVQLSVELHDPQLVLRCRRVALSQVVVDLLTNGCDAVAELPAAERWIKVGSRLRDGRVALAISDAGRVDAGTIARWFEPFYTTKPLGKGVGLGLSASRRTVEQHGGRLYVDPEAASTTLVIELPVAA
jgi:signal transduction histidine kinase